MTDRIPFVIPGALAPWSGVDHAIGVLGIAGSVVRVFMVVSDAPSGGSFTCALRDATGGGGDGITVTIPAGSKYATSTSTLAVSAAETLYLRVGADFGAANLSGWFEFEPTGTASVTTFLTTLTRVKTDEGISVSTHDAQLSRIIQGVSAAMERWMGRTIVDTEHAAEKHSGNGWASEIVLNHCPITPSTTFALLESAVAVDASLYEVDSDCGVIYFFDSVLVSGTRNYSVTYSAGYVAIPEDLALAATDQVRHEWHQSQPAGENRLGLTGTIEPAGISSTYVPHAFLPHVLEIMRPYRRLV
jgi:hypothetical protein